ncbi:MAG TPA: SCO family protein [Limnochordales bacterium]
MAGRLRWARRWALAGLLVVLLGVLGFAILKPVKVLPRLGPAPVFRLVDAEGRAVTHEHLWGRPVLYSFLTTSPDDRVGSVMARHLLALQDRLSQGSPDPPSPSPLLVTITVDPDRDTPERLKAWAERLGADPKRWILLTGAGLAVKLVVGTGFGVYYETPPRTYDSRYVLVDAAGEIRAVYRGPELDVATLMADLDLLRREAAAQGAVRLAYAAAHWFACYPVR